MIERNWNEVEVRVMGCLIEKSLATPDYYPITLNALTAACNQKSNRAPVMALDSDAVDDALDMLRNDKLVALAHQAGSHTLKYKHRLDEEMGLDPVEQTVLCELLVRGPQTVGELRTHGRRMYPALERQDVQDALDLLSEYRGQALVVRLSRRPGQKERRYTHLFSGAPPEEDAMASAPPEQAGMPGKPDDDALAELRGAMAQLANELNTLREQFAEFKRQFE